MARNEQLIRQHKLLEILERSRFGVTLAEIRDDLVEELGLSSLHTRSVRRDIKALEAAGFDISSQELQRGVVFKLGPRSKKVHKIAATSTELMALSLSRDLLLPLAGTSFWQGIESFWHKVQETLPDSVWAHYEKYRQVLHVLGTPAKSYEKQQGILKTINRAIMERRYVEIQYQSLAADRPKTHRIMPYAVALYQSSLYIVADFDDGRNDDKRAEGGEDRLRHLKLDRFRKATALDEWFTPRADFDVKKHLRESIGIFGGAKSRNFKIRVSALAARWIREDPWHPSQTIREQANGDVILTVKAAHDLEVIPKVLALGAEAEVLSPASCRNLIAETVQKMSDVYDQ